ncbi:carboxypeptidase-like regulatory domain-containing protein [uncultured Bacteroides sp.]|uniref:carboxypeptidase-like regulatory domain-containing protein n=1 Tax=uncultured Bacteroides sp. TaxID=162156 RepID=UPI002AA8E402|nr:carboxypeptidase-like regulatory domain-containing protein [uncultured Bacteroides sp.]
MKTVYVKAIGLFVALLVLGGAMPIAARDGLGYIVINGMVKDRLTKKKLENVNISVPGTNIGTITNADGEFTIKVTDSLHVATLDITHIGYFNQRFAVNGKDMKGVTIFLSPNSIVLNEILIQGAQPLKLVIDAIHKIADNNSPNTNMLTGFYRETVKKRRSYISISEAVINIYKTPYTENVDGDRIQVYKGRQLLSPKSGDTLAVKLMGGPNLSVYLDVVKNPDLLLDLETLSYYQFTMDKPVMINERPHYVVNFAPRVTLPYALFYGKLYIDQKTLAFSRAEFNLSMDDRNKATQAILKKKPYKLRFKPEEVSYLVTYKQHNDRSYLNYIRTEFDFRCDWKRKLFSTNYAIVSEMVVTNREEHNVINIPRKLTFNDKNSLSDKVGSFYDENFWEDYNIIAPTESLDAAVNKLMKHQR